jgi:hypothetical protein
MSKKDKSIKLSPKHGVNPCIPICCWCGKEKNEIALLGKLKEDAEAPRNAVLDYEPCEECQAKFNMGVVLIEVTKNQPNENVMPIQEQYGIPLYPTFRYSVIKLEAAKRLFENETLINGSRLLIEDNLYSELVGDKNV